MLCSSWGVPAGRPTGCRLASKMGRTCTAIIGSAGLIAMATSVIHWTFRDVSLFRSTASCCSRAKRTPWLSGSGTIANNARKSTCTRGYNYHKAKTRLCPNKDQVGWILADQLWEEDTWEHSHDTMETSLLCRAIVNASSNLRSDISLPSSFIGSNGASTCQGARQVRI